MHLGLAKEIHKIQTNAHSGEWGKWIILQEVSSPKIKLPKTASEGEKSRQVGIIKVK